MSAPNILRTTSLGFSVRFNARHFYIAKSVVIVRRRKKRKEDYTSLLWYIRARACVWVSSIIFHKHFSPRESGAFIRSAPHKRKFRNAALRAYAFLIRPRIKVGHPLICSSQLVREEDRVRAVAATAGIPRWRTWKGALNVSQVITVAFRV